MTLRKIIKIVFGLTKLFIYKMMYRKRLKIKSIKQNLALDTEIIIGKKASLSLGRIRCNSDLHLECYLGEMNIGRVAFNRHCIISCRYKIDIGDNCFFGPNVCVYDHDHKYSIDGVSPDEYRCSEIIIEEGCWICAGAIILRGTHIGKNSVIEAGAVVRGKIPPNSLVTAIKETRIIPTAILLHNEKRAGELLETAEHAGRHT